MNILDVLVTATERDNVLKTFDSFLSRVVFSGTYRFLVNIDARTDTYISSIKSYLDHLSQTSPHHSELFVNRAYQGAYPLTQSGTHNRLFYDIKSEFYFYLNAGIIFLKDIDLDQIVGVMEKNALIDQIHFGRERTLAKSLLWYHHGSGMRQKFIDNVPVIEEGLSLVRVPSWSMSPHVARTNTLKLFLPIPDNINVEPHLSNNYIDSDRCGIYNYGPIGEAPYVQDSGGLYVYDALINWQLLDECNLNCSYCFLPPWIRRRKARPINIEAFMRNIERTGKIFHVKFTGGEPFLMPNFTELVSALTEKHYVSIITNLTSGLIPSFLGKVNKDHIISIAASFHACELDRTGLMKQYLGNFDSCKKSGIYIYAGGIAHPSYVDYVDEWRELLKEHDITLDMNSFVGMYQGRQYPGSYSNEEIEIFNMQKENPKRYDQHNNICNAGYNFIVAMPNGDVFPCYQFRREKMGNLFKTFSLQSRLRRCPFSLCKCPLNYFYPDLFLKAVADVDPEPRSFSRSHYFIDKVKRRCWHLLTQHK